MEAKVKEWKAEKAKSESNNLSQENPPWYKTPAGIIKIIGSGLLLSLLLVWLLARDRKKAKNSL